MYHIQLYLHYYIMNSCLPFTHLSSSDIMLLTWHEHGPRALADGVSVRRTIQERTGFQIISRLRRQGSKAVGMSWELVSILFDISGQPTQ